MAIYALTKHLAILNHHICTFSSHFQSEGMSPHALVSIELKLLLVCDTHIIMA